MKTSEVSEASDFLREYGHEPAAEVVTLTDHGAPLAAVVPLRGMDRETLAVSSSATFQAIMERARVRRRTEGGFSHAEILREFGMDPDRPGGSGRASSQ
jgi:antitoxin (DNA-binding transcriptional repressor) of toxin-antitoxin stability system